MTRRLFPHRSLLVVAAVAALSLAGCGGDDDDSGGTDTTAAEGTTTTAAGETTTSAAGETTTTAAAEETTLRLYFMQGEKLGVVHRTLAAGVTPGQAALEALVEGPTADEEALGFGTTIPEGTELLGLSIADGIATADFSGTYDDGGGTMSMSARLAEVVFTLTQFPTVEAVSFELDGEPVTTFSGEGIMLEEPVGRDDYTDLMPMILVEEPAPGDAVTSPLTVTGLSNTFESNVEYRLDDDAGIVLDEGFTTGEGEMGTWGPFEITVDFDPGAATEGTLVVFESSAADGSAINVIEVPLRFG